MVYDNDLIPENFVNGNVRRDIMKNRKRSD